MLDIIPKDIVNYLYRYIIGTREGIEGVARLIGSKNKNTTEKVITSSLSSDERVKLLANLIIDKVIEDQKNKYVFLKKILSTKHVNDYGEL